MRITSSGLGQTVYVDGRILDLDESMAVWPHSPTGFGWGYGGSGPSQLALAILLRAGIPADTAVELHHAFKWDHVAMWPEDDPLNVDVDVVGWVNAATMGTG